LVAKRPILQQLVWLIAFSIAMGFLEAAVVVYLRLHFYPNGFEFPLVSLDVRVGMVEIIREGATVVMLLGVGVLAGNNFQQRLSYFLLAFAIWDLFYYVFLKFILDWPSSWLTWDILFLIPAPWVGPVLSAVIASMTMVIFAWAILQKEFQSKSQKINTQEWVLIILGSLIIILSWMWDYIIYSGHIVDVSHHALEALSTYVPHQFNWWMFSIGDVFLIAAIFLYARRTE
jgi:hypothetical protein